MVEYRSFEHFVELKTIFRQSWIIKFMFWYSKFWYNAVNYFFSLLEDFWRSRCIEKWIIIMKKTKLPYPEIRHFNWINCPSFCLKPMLKSALKIAFDCVKSVICLFSIFNPNFFKISHDVWRNNNFLIH